ncbi:MAG: aldo/keto reductase [Ruminiclostridium sp.]|nr:aldo/keto reductase [Ruminiclostridium sp.]
MESVILNNGRAIPMVGFGTWQILGDQCETCVRQALDLGYRLIDTARMYENEEAVGRGIRASGIPREEIFLTTKVFQPDNSYQGTRAAIDQSLLRLDTDYIDLFLIHEPYEEDRDMVRAMREALEAGKIRALGISNYNKDLYARFVTECGLVPAVNQVEAHVLHQQLSLKEAMDGTVLQAWSPLTCGQRPVVTDPVLAEIGAKYGKTAAQIALKALVQQGIPVVPKTVTPSRMKENLDIFDFTLSSEDMTVIRAMDTGKTLFGWY